MTTELYFTSSRFFAVYHSTGGPLTITNGQSTPIQEYFHRAAAMLQFPTIDCNGRDIIGSKNVIFIINVNA